MKLVEDNGDNMVRIRHKYFPGSLTFAKDKKNSWSLEYSVSPARRNSSPTWFDLYAFHDCFSPTLSAMFSAKVRVPFS